MKHRMIAAAFAVALLAGAARAVHVVSDIGAGTEDGDWPSLANSPDGATVVAWEEKGVGIWTQGLSTYPPEEGALAQPLFHGPGSRPQVVWTRSGFLLAWTVDTRIAYGVSPASVWTDPPQMIDTGHDLDGSMLDVHGCTGTEPGLAWIVYTTPDGGGGRAVVFLNLSDDGAGAPVTIADGLTEPVSPRVVAVPGNGQPPARVFYFRDDIALAYRTGQTDGTWSSETVLPFGMFGTEMAAAVRVDGTCGVLSLGPQPTCPCNMIQFVGQAIDGAWQTPEPLTVQQYDYDWPMSPCVTGDEDGRTHAFWSQLGPGPSMEPHGRDLEYRVRENGAWIDRGDFLDEHLSPGTGSRVAMALALDGQPVFAWTRKDTIGGLPQPQFIVLARPKYPVGVDEIVRPDAGPSLQAWPNPFNPRLPIAGTASGGAPSSRTILDLAGRRLTSLPVRPDDHGRFTTTWNGVDRTGRAAPAGVYLIRLAAEDGIATRRVVLTR